MPVFENKGRSFPQVSKVSIEDFWMAAEVPEFVLGLDDRNRESDIIDCKRVIASTRNNIAEFGYDSLLDERMNECIIKLRQLRAER